MKFVSTLLFCLLAGHSLCAQDIHALTREGNRLELLPDEKAAFTKFKEVIKIQPNNIYALNKCSELCSRIGQRELTNTKLRDEYYRAAKIYAQMALKAAPTNSEAHCVMAIALGRATMSKSGKEKITYVKEIKKYADAAIHYDAQNFKAWHVLGRWHYEISNLNTFERSLVKIFYGGFPPSSYKMAIDAFERARYLRPEFLLNYFEMAKAYKDNNNKERAMAYLRLMNSLPNQTEDDPGLKEKSKELLEDWR